MPTYQLNNLNFSFTVRKAPKNGPTSSDKWNDSVTEISNDLIKISQEWNTKVTIVLNALPDGSLDTTVNAFVNGLDGSNLWVDQNADATAVDPKYFNAGKARPNTVKEQFDAVYSDISTEIANLEVSLSAASGGLTAGQKARIGSNIFDSSTASSASSLDGKSENSRQNIIQIGTDLYGDGVALNNDGHPILTNSVKAMVNALLAIHGGNWPNNISVSHAAVGSFTSLLDVPHSYAGQAGLIVKVNPGENGLIFGTAPSSITQFTQLTDAPASYATFKGQFVVVNNVEGALEFSTVAPPVTTISSGVKITSPNGTQYLLTVNDDGSLSTTAV